MSALLLMNPANPPSLVKDVTYEVPVTQFQLQNANDGQLKFIDKKEETTHRPDFFFKINHQRLTDGIGFQIRAQYALKSRRGT